MEERRRERFETAKSTLNPISQRVYLRVKVVKGVKKFQR